MKDAKITVSKKGVTLEIDDIDNCRFELWTLNEETKSCVKIKIPEKIWIRLINQWKEQRGESETF